MKHTLVPMLFAAMACLPLASQVQAQTETAIVTTVPMSAKININEADAETLARELTGVGPAKARAIVDYRERQGAFVTVDELLEVKGIGVSILERIRDRVAVE